MRLCIPDGVPDLGGRNSTTGALGDEPPSRSAIGGTSRECSVALSPSAQNGGYFRRTIFRHCPLPQVAVMIFSLHRFSSGRGPPCIFSTPFLEIMSRPFLF